VLNNGVASTRKCTVGTNGDNVDGCWVDRQSGGNGGLWDKFGDQDIFFEERVAFVIADVFELVDGGVPAEVFRRKGLEAHCANNDAIMLVHYEGAAEQRVVHTDMWVGVQCGWPGGTWVFVTWFFCLNFNLWSLEGEHVDVVRGCDRRISK
jgi:hypothetical protein